MAVRILSFYAMSPIPAMGSIPGQELRSEGMWQSQKRIKKTKQNQGKKGELNEKDSMERKFSDDVYGVNSQSLVPVRQTGKACNRVTILEQIKG